MRIHDKRKALELLGKYRTLSTEKVEHVFKDVPQLDLSKFTDEELDAWRVLAEKALQGHGGSPEDGTDRKEVWQ